MTQKNDQQITLDFSLALDIIFQIQRYVKMIRISTERKGIWTEEQKEDLEIIKDLSLDLAQRLESVLINCMRADRWL